MHPFAERNPRLWAMAESFAVIVICSLLFWLFSALIITIPAALVGLYAAVGGAVRNAPGNYLYRYWHGFRRSFGTALLLGLLNLVAGLLLWVDIRFFWTVGTPVTKALAFAFGSLVAMVVMVNLFAWPLLAWYPQPLGKLLKRSFLLAAAHPFLAIGGIVGSLVALYLFLLLPGPLLGLLPAVGPGLFVAISSAVAWQAMKRYVDPDDELMGE